LAQTQTKSIAPCALAFVPSLPPSPLASDSSAAHGSLLYCLYHSGSLSDSSCDRQSDRPQHSAVFAIQTATSCSKTVRTPPRTLIVYRNSRRHQHEAITPVGLVQVLMIITSRNKKPSCR